MKIENLKKVVIIVSIAILIMINLVCITAVDKFNFKIDMTENKLYELSDTTYEVAEAISESVNITIFSSKDDFVIMLKEIFERYNNLSEKINVTYKDPYQSPVLIDEYKQKGIDIKADDILIEGVNRYKLFTIQDMYNLNTSKSEITGLKAEQQITSSLIYVNDTSVPIVAFTDGHNERPTTALFNLFEQNNFNYKRVTLDIMGLSGDEDIIVIASPTRDFEKSEIDVLNEFINAGGSILVFLEPSVNEFSNLTELLNAWGIGVMNNVIFEKQAFVSGNEINIVPMYASHEINKYFGDNRYFLAMPSSRGLYKVVDAGYDLDVYPVLVSSPESYAKVETDYKTIKKQQDDIVGPFYVAMSSSREVGDGVARILAVGSRNMYADDLLETATYANADFLTQSMNWLNKSESSINISAKSIKADPISVLPRESTAMGIVFIGVIPVLILALGVSIYFRRKNL